MIKSNTSHIGFEDTKCPMGVETVLTRLDCGGLPWLDFVVSVASDRLLLAQPIPPFKI